MTLVCDGCGGEIADLTRPQAFVPLADGGGVDLCKGCSEALADYFADDADAIAAELDALDEDAVDQEPSDDAGGDA